MTRARGRPARPGRRMRGALSVLLLWAAAAVAAGSPAGAQESHLVVAAGLGGAPEHRDAFHRWSVRLVDAAHGRFGLPDGRIHYLGERPERDPERIDGRSSAEALIELLERIGARAGEDDRLLLVLFGHGSWDGEEARINLPGPDLDAAELDRVLDAAFPTQTVAVVNAASASGAFVPALSGPRRIVLTATASGGERNATRFGRHFVDALAREGADTDKDGGVSLLEAFSYARREVARAYDEENLLLTEHALLDDDGDGEGIREPAAPGGEDGARAATFVLGAGDGRAAETSDDPELRALHRERQRLEERIRALTSRRQEMEAAAYDDALEALLVELALTNREIREREGGGP